MTTPLMDELIRMFNEEAPIARYFGMRLWFDDRGVPSSNYPTTPTWITP